MFRGALGPIFSRGMDRLTSRLEEAGVRADVYEFTICRLIAAQAIRDYREDPVPITLIGHSMGGLCTLIFADILRSENIPVSLVVTIDPAHASPKVPLNVERFINIFLSTSILGGGDVVAEPGYQGHYASFDMKDHEEVTHINIDKMDSIHEQLVAAIIQLATTPVQSQGETVPLRYVVPPDAPLETLGQRHPAIRPFGRHVAAACGAQPRAAVVAHPSQSIAGRCTADRWPARHHPAPARVAGPAADPGGGAGETVNDKRYASAGRQERDQHRDPPAIRSVGFRAEFGGEESFLHAGLLPHAERDQHGTEDRRHGSNRNTRRQHSRDQPGVDRVAHEAVRARVDDPMTFLVRDRVRPETSEMDSSPTM